MQGDRNFVARKNSCRSSDAVPILMEKMRNRSKIRMRLRVLCVGEGIELYMIFKFAWGQVGKLIATLRIVDQLKHARHCMFENRGAGASALESQKISERGPGGGG